MGMVASEMAGTPKNALDIRSYIRSIDLIRVRQAATGASRGRRHFPTTRRADLCVARSLAGGLLVADKTRDRGLEGSGRPPDQSGKLAAVIEQRSFGHTRISVGQDPGEHLRRAGLQYRRPELFRRHILVSN